MKPTTSTSVAEKYNGKVIGILGQQTIIGRILIKKLLHQLSGISKIILINTNSKKISKGTHIKETYLQDPYFSNVELEKLEYIMNFHDEQEKGIDQKVDILFNCHIPVDLTRKGIQNCLQSHVEKTKKICDYLKTLKIDQIVMVSSIYCQIPGYISESMSNQDKQILNYVPHQIKSKQQLLDNLREVFKSEMQIWQWSIVFMESLYSQSSKSSKTHIIRIPLIGPTLTNYEGYLTNFNSLTNLIYEVGNTFIDSLQGISENIIDIIPADFVTNYMIVVAVNEQPSELVQQTLKQNKDYLGTSFNTKLHNLSSSSRNPIKLQNFAQFIVDGWAQYSEKRIKLKIQEKKWQRKLYNVQKNLPIQAKKRIAELFDLKSWKIEAQQNNINTFKKMEIMKKYRHFFEREWVCESNKSIDYFNNLSHEDQLLFHFNVNSINWKTYAKLCCYSINKYLLGLEVQKFSPSNLDLLNLQKSSYFSDILWAITEGKPAQIQSSKDLKKYIMSTKSVKDAIEEMVEKQIKKLEQGPTAYEKLKEQYYKVGDQMCDQMFSQYSMRSIRIFAWFLHKVFRTIYEKVVIDKTSMNILKNRDESQGPLIVIPTHRSYIDFLIMSYVFFGYGIKVPHIAAAQDFLNMAVIHILLRKSGAFFIKRNQKKNKQLYKAIMTQYITKLLAQNHYLQFFIEGTRSRVGKMLSPKFGILSTVAKNVLQGKIPDATILPITINYEKVLEGASFTYQLMGQTKVKQSLSRLIKAADVLKQNYGRIYIELCTPISMKKYFAVKSPKYEGNTNSFQLILSELGSEIVNSLSDNLLVTPPAIISSIILMNRIGISDDRLSEKVQWLCKEISSRNIKIARNQADSSISVGNTLALLGDIVTKSKKDMFQVQVSFDQSSFTQLFTLTYYRNTLTHIFFEEAIIAVAIGSFGYQNMIQPKVKLQNLYSQSLFLASLLKRQFVLKNSFNEKRFEELISFMVGKKFIHLNSEGYVVVVQPQGNLFSFYCSLVWPIVQTYWVSCLYLFKLLKDNLTLEMAKLQTEIQWFAQSLITQRITLYLESISIDTIKNALGSLSSLKVIKEVRQNNRLGVKVMQTEEELKKMEGKISEFLKSKYAASIKGLLNSGRGSVNLDFPFLSKM